MSHDRSNRGRRVGKPALLDAAIELLTEARLNDVGAFLTARTLAAKAGVSTGTVSHHFKGVDETGTSRLIIETLREAVARQGTAVSSATRVALAQAIEDLRQGDESALRTLADIAAQDLLGYTGVLPSETAVHLVAAVAPSDREAAEELADMYEGALAPFPAMYEEIAATMGRRFTSEFSSRDFAEALSAMVDGLAQRDRFRPDPDRQRLFSQTVLSLFLGVTVELSDPEDPLPMAQRLIALPAGSALDPHKREAIVKATNDLYDEGGWGAVTITSVAERAGVNRATIGAHFGGRGGLAAVVVARFVPGLIRALADDEAQDMDLGRLLWRHVQRLTERVRSHVEASMAMVEASIARGFTHGLSDANDPTDPRNIAPLTGMMTDLLLRKQDELRPGLIRSRTDAMVLSALIHLAAMPLILARFDQPASEVADFVVMSLLYGALPRS